MADLLNMHPPRHTGWLSVQTTYFSDGHLVILKHKAAVCDLSRLLVRSVGQNTSASSLCHLQSSGSPYTGLDVNTLPYDGINHPHGGQTRLEKLDQLSA